MRIRKIEIDYGHGKKIVDFRKDGAYPSPLIGILGNTGSGKTLLMKSTLFLFRRMATNNVPVLWDKLSSTVEFDLGSTISTGVIKKGVITQNIADPDSRTSKLRYENGLLIYDDRRYISGFMAGSEFSVASIEGVIKDLYKGEIRNSVIWVDNYDLGLDNKNSRDFLQLLMKKSLERDNQLVVSSTREESLELLGVENLRRLSENRESVVERVTKSL